MMLIPMLLIPMLLIPMLPIPITTNAILTTPRGAQDKQPLALTWRELPWTTADYKTRHNTIGQSVLHESSAEPHLQSVTRKLLYEYNKRITRLAYRPLRLPTSFHITATMPTVRGR